MVRSPLRNRNAWDALHPSLVNLASHLISHQRRRRRRRLIQMFGWSRLSRRRRFKSRRPFKEPPRSKWVIIGVHRGCHAGGTKHLYCNGHRGWTLEWRPSFIISLVSAQVSRKFDSHSTSGIFCFGGNCSIVCQWNVAIKLSRCTIQEPADHCAVGDSRTRIWFGYLLFFTFLGFPAIICHAWLLQ